MSHWIKDHPPHLINEWVRVLSAYDEEISKERIDLIYQYIDGSIVFILFSDDRCFTIEDAKLGYWHVSVCDRPNSVAVYRKWLGSTAQQSDSSRGTDISAAASKVST